MLQRAARRILMQNKDLVGRVRVGVGREKTGMYYECRHIMPNGSKCKSPSLRGKPYCYYHTRLHRLANAPVPTADEPLRLPVLEDRGAIQVALSQVLAALGSSKLDTRRAGLFLYGIQIASQNVERDDSLLPLPSETVEVVTQTKEGDELAPEQRTCRPNERCFCCPDRNTCPSFDPEDVDEEEEDEDDEE